MTKAREFLGTFRTVRLIRAGSRCFVWEAINEGDDGERYALKVVRENMSPADIREETANLKHEFEVAKDLKHKSIIRMDRYDDTSARTPFLVMELFSELNLKQGLRKGPDPIAHLVQTIIEQSAESLYYMHSKGWVHCDLKPDNFLVSNEGKCKLIDFTIAQKAKKKTLKQMLGMRGAVKGTRSYMAPEQIRGQVLDGRTDVYALGCVIYEMISGKPPFTGETPTQLLNKHLSNPPPSALVVNDNVTQEFNDLIKRMMSKKPEQRYGSMWEFLKEFRQTRLFKKAPRLPEESIFDDLPEALGHDDLLRKGKVEEDDI